MDGSKDGTMTNFAIDNPDGFILDHPSNAILVRDP